MKPFLLPKKLIDKIEEKKSRDFFWGSTTESKKFHTLKWNETTKPKKLGGLGIKNLAIQNKSIIIGQLWKIRKKTIPRSILNPNI